MKTQLNKQEHAVKADKLELQGSQALDKTKSGHSQAAAELLTKANEERFKAGLISKLMQK